MPVRKVACADCHSPRGAVRILAESIDYARQVQVVALTLPPSE